MEIIRRRKRRSISRLKLIVKEGINIWMIIRMGIM